MSSSWSTLDPTCEEARPPLPVADAGAGDALMRSCVTSFDSSLPSFDFFLKFKSAKRLFDAEVFVFAGIDAFGNRKSDSAADVFVLVVVTCSDDALLAAAGLKPPTSDARISFRLTFGFGKAGLLTEAV